MMCYDDHPIEHKPRSSLTTTAVSVDSTVLDLTRYPNVCKLDFGNSAYKYSISFDFSLFFITLTKAALPFSAVRKSSVMLSVPSTADAMLTSGSVAFLDLKGFKRPLHGTL